MVEPDRWLDTKALAEYIKVRSDRIWHLVTHGFLPAPFYVLGPRSPRWDRLTIDAWMAGKSLMQPEPGGKIGGVQSSGKP